MPAIQDLSSEQRLHLLSEQVKYFAIFILDLQGNIVEWLTGAETLTGWAAEEIVGKSAAIIFTPEDRAAGAFENELATARSKGEASDVRWHMRRDGSRFFADGILLAIRDENDADCVIGFGKILHDVTNRKELTDYLWRQASLLDLSYDPAFSWELNSHRIVYWNKSAAELYGFAQDNAVGKDAHALLHTVFPIDLAGIKTDLKQTGKWQGELIQTLQDGREIHVDSRMVLRGDLGQEVIVLETNRDVTERRLAEEAAQDAAERVALATDAAKLGIWVWETDSGKVVWENDRAYEIFGIPKTSESINAEQFFDGLLHPDDVSEVQQAIQSTKNANGRIECEARFYRQPNHELRWLKLTGVLNQKNVGISLRVVGTVADITTEKQAEERMRQIALHDPLTGLPNRRLMFEYADHIFGRSRRAGQVSGVLFVDLDRFKPINDNYGHEIGDAVLKEVAKRLMKCVRKEDIVFRIGGDEFTVLLPSIASASGAGEVARHLSACLNQPYHIEDLELRLSASIGVSIFPRDGEDIDTLTNHADSAMYQAKQEGRNGVQFYSQDLAARLEAQTLIEERLKIALSQNSFELYYQPVIDTANERLIGVEALLRWPYTEWGPDRFIPIAEVSGQIDRLGDWVISEACRQHIAWQEKGLPIIPIAVNVSTVQFRRKNFADRFARIVEDHKIGMSVLQMEVTESALIENLDHAVDVLARLGKLGVKIALDDFGTGYSSLNYLSRLPIDKIKVDKSFVQRLDSDAASRAITEAVIALGRTLNLEIVAEGIESKEELNYLREHGCTQAQGYYVCRPLSAASFEAWYKQRLNSLLH